MRTALCEAVSLYSESNGDHLLRISGVDAPRDDTLEEVYPYTKRDAIIAAICDCFWWKRGLRAFLLECGVPPQVYDQVAVGSKGQFIPVLVNQLASRGDAGAKVLDKVASELMKLDGPVDRDSLDVNSAVKSLERLRNQFSGGTADEETEKAKAEERRRLQEQAAASAVQREKELKLSQCRALFYELCAWSGCNQERGRIFENELLAKLFDAYDIPYVPRYRSLAQEIDGSFEFGGRHFILEVRWRKDEADFNALSHLNSKVELKVEGTLGLFLSMEGFEGDAVAALLQAGRKKVLLLDGANFVKIVEGYVSLPDAIKQMLNEAARRGNVQAS